ncbi:MAG: hypothetical protein QF689_13145 [Candidatus Latescibacteria bacterium]|nr:hypothetical protein [Gemmatimonadaceae bacterium]MDP6017016.1 hypothetical protein [Candidatus Latescibacterota bacterium]MDP7449531.1 hypothetical protein [Candidatus Latescibacterota bacterium]HJP32744.1 hypothetical protein [Candidatus Latescibacterota bacterium]
MTEARLGPAWSADTVAAVSSPPTGSCWVDLPQGPGATDLAVARLQSLLEQGVRGDRILVLLPQRDRRSLYESPAADRPRAGTRPQVHTYYSLTTRLVRLFWPVAAGDAGFHRPRQAPVQLTYETAQYVMGQVAEPLLRQGYFEGLTLRPQRILSQLLDNLNKAAVNGYDVAHVADRLRAAWTGDGDRLVYFEQAQTCVERFRAHCLQHNLLDVSLALEVFRTQLEPRAVVAAYLDEHFRHLLVEGVEETVPVAQDFVGRRLEAADSAFLVSRRNGGFRVFLGVDPEGAVALRSRCATVISLDEGPPRPARILGEALARRIEGGGVSRTSADSAEAESVRRLVDRHRGGMVDAVAREVVRLVSEGEAQPGDIAIIAPHADGVLRFLIDEALGAAGIPCAIVRRFESLREEPEVRIALALAALAHDGWRRPPHLSDVAEALGVVLGIDPVRARLLARAGYDPRAGGLRCLGDDEVLAERATPEALQGYEALRTWLEARRAGEPLSLDLFLRRLFGEVLSRPDLDPGAGDTYARLISSAAWFRRSAPAMEDALGARDLSAAEGYVAMVEEGVVSAAHTVPMSAADEESVLVVAPVYTYLLEERTARYQFWLDVGSISWWEPPHQPLTNPHVLARGWQPGGRWTDAVDFETRNRVLARLVRGLCSRASGTIYLCWSETEGGAGSGHAADTPLLRAAMDLLGPLEEAP